MMESSHKSPTENIIHPMTSIMDPSTNNYSSGIDSGKPASMAQPCIAATATLPGIKHGESSTDILHDGKATVATARDIKAAGSTFTLPASETRLGAKKAPAHESPSLFAKLPGELRNRIYRAYFDMFLEERETSAVARDEFLRMIVQELQGRANNIWQKTTKVNEKVVDIMKTLPPYLKLLHTDHMIRSEAGSIFDKEYLSIDCFATICDLQGDMWARIRAICDLVAIRNVSLPLSITCTKREFRPPRGPGMSGNSPTYVPQFMFLRVMVQILSEGRHEMLRQDFKSQQDGEHPFFSKKGDVGTEMRIGQDYLIQTKDNFDGHSTVETTMCVSGPLAKLYWPRCRWRELINFRWTAT